MDIGGRLIQVDKATNKISYISDKIEKLADSMGITIQKNDDANYQQIQQIVKRMTEILEEAIGLREASDMLEKMFTNHGLKDDYEIEYLSFTAGLAFTQSGLGINHSLAHAIGGKFAIPHGRANAILLPHVIKYNSKLEEDSENETAARYAKISKLLGLPSDSVTEGVQSLIFGIKELMKRMNIPQNFQDAGIAEEKFYQEIERMSETVIEDPCTQTNPKSVVTADFIEIYEKAYSNKS